MLATKLGLARTERTSRLALLYGTAAILAGTIGVSGHAFAQAVNIDGGFNGAGDPTHTTTLSNGSSVLPPWTVSLGESTACVVTTAVGGGMGDINGCSGMGTAHDVGTQTPGANYVALMVDSGVQSSITSVGVVLSAGKSYTLTYDIGLSGIESGVNNITWAVSVAGAGASISGTTSTTLNVTGIAFTGWLVETATITIAPGSTASDTIKFLASSTTGGPPIAVIDNISLVQNSVPEPASLAIVGIGLAGLVKLRRRRTSAVSIAV